MYIPPHNPINQSQYIRSSQSIAGVRNVEINQAPPVAPITPQNHYYGPVSQLINSQYLFQLRNQNVRRLIKGRKLKEILSHDYSLEEYENLPIPLQTLVKFDRTINTAEILQFMETLDSNHEISFRDYAFDRIKFRALFEALGALVDVEMQAGPTTFVSLNDDFEVKRKIKEIFVELKNKITNRVIFKSRRKSNPDEVWEELMEINENGDNQRSQ